MRAIIQFVVVFYFFDWPRTPKPYHFECNLYAGPVTMNKFACMCSVWGFRQCACVCTRNRRTQCKSCFDYETSFWRFSRTVYSCVIQCKLLRQHRVACQSHIKLEQVAPDTTYDACCSTKKKNGIVANSEVKFGFIHELVQLSRSKHKFSLTFGWPKWSVQVDRMRNGFTVLQWPTCVCIRKNSPSTKWHRWSVPSLQRERWIEQRVKCFSFNFRCFRSIYPKH